LKNKFNLIGLKEKFEEDLNFKENGLSDKTFYQMIKHIFKSSVPSPVALQDEKYV